MSIFSVYPSGVLRDGHRGAGAPPRPGGEIRISRENINEYPACSPGRYSPEFNIFFRGTFPTQSIYLSTRNANPHLHRRWRRSCTRGGGPLASPHPTATGSRRGYPSWRTAWARSSSGRRCRRARATYRATQRLSISVRYTWARCLACAVFLLHQMRCACRPTQQQERRARPLSFRSQVHPQLTGDPIITPIISNQINRNRPSPPTSLTSTRLFRSPAPTWATPATQTRFWAPACACSRCETASSR